MRKLKAKPKLIYPKNVIDHAFLLVEGGRNVENYDCSHTFMYGNQISHKEQLSTIEKTEETNPTIVLQDNSNLSSIHTLKDGGNALSLQQYQREEAKRKAEQTLKVQEENQKLLHEIAQVHKNGKIFQVNDSLINEHEKKMFRYALVTMQHTNKLDMNTLNKKVKLNKLNLS